MQAFLSFDPTILRNGPVEPRFSFHQSAVMLLVTTILLSASSLFALDPHKSVTQYGHNVWLRQNGLPANAINVVLQSRDGYLWLGTSAGLFRFDGVSFTEIATHPSNANIHETITALRETNDGSLWIGTAYNGLRRLKNGAIALFGLNEGFFDTNVRELFVSRVGHLVVCTAIGVFVLRNERLEPVSLDQNYITGVAQDSQDKIWVGTLDGVRTFEDDGTNMPHVITLKQGLQSNTVTSILRDRDGSVWVGTYAGLTKWRNGKMTDYAGAIGPLNDHINALYQDRNGSLWVGTQKGISRYSNGVWSAFTTSEGLTDNEVLSFIEDQEGSLWVGTANGLNQFKETGISSFTVSEGLADDHVASIVQGLDESVYFFSDQSSSMTQLKNGRFTRYNDISAGTVFVARDSSLWMGQSGMLLNFRNGVLKRFDAHNGLPAKWISAITEDDSSLIFYADHAGIFRFVHERVQPFLLKDGSQYPSKNYVVCFYRQHNDILWIGMGDSLVRIQNGSVSGFTRKGGLAGNWVSSFSEDRDGILWISSPQGGLSRYKDGKFTAYNTNVGLFTDGIYCVLADDLDGLWLSSAMGIGYVKREELNDLASGRTGTIHTRVYGSTDGMKTDVCFGQWQPAGCKTHDGSLWFATKKGAVLIHPGSFAQNQLRPPVYIEQIIADRQNGTPDSSMSIASGTEKLEFRYTALSYLVPERVRFKYMLEGYDRDWVEAGTRRTAFYTNLPPRSYRFRVKACNNDGLWNEVGASFAFDLEPYFYETTWFFGLALIGIVGATFGAYRLRVWRLLRRKTELETRIQEAIANIKVLGGLIPICSSCKKIRDDKGYWDKLEAYIQTHSEAKFSHGICPDCAKKLYPDVFNSKTKGE